METKRYKFIVKSAEEAVTVLREKIGPSARVISVRQVEGAGLSRFLTAPKLEVVAENGTEGQSGEEQRPEDAPIADEQSDASSDSAELSGLERMLTRAGIPRTVLARLQNTPGWPQLERLTYGQALRELSVLLRGEYQKRPRIPLSTSIAFLGTPGSGKTTALCKRMAADVFIRGRKGRVLKLDMEKANPGDGLAVFCDAMGVPLVRCVEDALPGAGETLYIDLPGICPGSAMELQAVSSALSEIPGVSRVLVANAAYDSVLIKEAYGMAAILQATHVVFTHLDELSHWGKLWEFLLAASLSPAFLSTGQNIAGDMTDEVFDAVNGRTFPLVSDATSKWARAA